MKYRSVASFVALIMGSVATNAQEQKPSLFHVNHMELGITLGTTGIGFDVAIPAIDRVWLRTGFSYMPRIEVPMTFDVQVGDDPATSQSKFDKLSSLLSNFTGNKVEPEVEMIGKPKFWNWNFMVDVFPLKNNYHWHATIGFSLGPTKVAEAFNKTESMASLLSVDIYNNLYDKLHGLSRRELLQVKLFDIPGMEDFGTDPNLLIELQKHLDSYGRMGMRMGKYAHDIIDAEGKVIHQKDDAYVMTTDENSMVSANMKVNAFKPYLGIGYEGHLIKGENRVAIGFDAGAMFWGGTPHLTTHDGTDLIYDVKYVPGKVGDYVSTIKKFKVFPLLNLRIVYKLF